MKPQPGQWIYVPKDYPTIDPDGVLLDCQHLVIEPGEFEEEDEITIDVDGVDYYVQATRVQIVPPPDA